MNRRRPFVTDSNRYYSPAHYPQNFIIVSTPLTIPVNFLPAGELYRQLSLVNDRRMIRLLRRVIKDYGVKEYLFINFFDPFFLGDIPSEIAPALKVYHCMDDISQVPYTARHGLRLEEAIMRKFDLVLCTSSELLRLKSKFNHNTRLMPNAADYELFSIVPSMNSTESQVLVDVPRPIVGFTGSLEYRTDFGLLEKAIKFHQDKSFVFIGPVSASVEDLKLIQKYSNVFFVDALPIEKLPRYLHLFDCAIIPYKKNTLTRSIYPLKINEYLAAGKPIVATAFSDDVSSFSDVAFIALDDADFIKSIDTAINTNNEEKTGARKAKAATNTWEQRVAQFWALVEETY